MSCQKRNVEVEDMDVNIKDMSPEEYRKLLGSSMLRRLTSRKVMTNKSFIPPRDTTSIKDPIPPKWDWREHGKVAEICSHGSEQQFVDCVYQDVPDSGVDCTHAWECIIKTNPGIAYRRDYPDEGQKEECKQSQIKEKPLPQGYTEVYPHSDKAIMAAVYKYGEVAVNIDASHENFQNYTSGIFDEEACENPPSDELNHTVTIVGYDTTGEKDYWIIRNSWGESWGENGHMRIVMWKNMCGINTDPHFIFK